MLSATQKARRNIKLLEEADHDAINKVGEAKFKKILTDQEKQLHHYLAQYTDPNYLPKGITKEYEFPKYFYYTVNSKKNGVVQKRTRVDSAMFKRLMKNKSKKEQAKAQGVFKITDEPIKINIEMNKKTQPKKRSDLMDIMGNVGFSEPEDPNRLKRYMRDPNYYNTGDAIITIEDILEHPKKTKSNKIKNMKFDELIESVPSYTPIKKNITIKPRSKQIDIAPPKSSSLKNKFKIQVIKDALDRAIIKKANSTMEQKYIIDKKFKKQYKTAMQNRDFKVAMAMVYSTKKDIEHDIPLKIKELVDERKDINNKLKNTEDPKKIQDMNARKREIARFIKLEKTSMDNAIKRLPQLLENLEFERKLFYNRGEATVEIPENAHKMTISQLLNRGLTKSQIASIKGKGIKYLDDDDYDSE